MKLIAIGDNVVDCYLDQNLYYPGGNCVNVAVQSSRNGADEISYIGVFGNDGKAEAIKAALKQESVSYNFSRTMFGISGQPSVGLVDGDRVFIGGPKDTVQHLVKMKLTNRELLYVSSFDICHVSVYSNMEEELPSLKEVVPISYDFSDEYTEEYLEKICPHVTYAFFSVSHLTDEKIEELASRVLDFGVEIVGTTKGEEGARFYTKERIFNRKPDSTEVLDTMGAGDSFIAGFLTEYVENKDMNGALDKAAASSAKTCTYYGGIGYPHELISKK